MKSPNASRVIEGLERLFALYGQDFKPVLAPIWIEALADLTPGVIEKRFLDVERTFKPTAACPFPTPAHIREPIDRARVLELHERAEGAWQEFLNEMNLHWHPDLGWHQTCRSLQLPHTMAAVAAAGGLLAIYESAPEQLVWRKKEFVAAYLRGEQLEDLAPLLPAENIRPLLEGPGKTLLSGGKK